MKLMDETHFVHKLMSDQDLKVNVYNWEVEDKGFRKARYKDYVDCVHHTRTELFLLCREKVTEEAERERRYRRK